MLTIKPTNKPCAICMAEKQIVDVSFDDGSFKGCCCWKDLWRMIEARNAKAADSKTSRRSAAPAS